MRTMMVVLVAIVMLTLIPIISKAESIDAFDEEWNNMSIDQRREEVKKWDKDICEDCLSTATSFSDYRDKAIEKNRVKFKKEFFKKSDKWIEDRYEELNKKKYGDGSYPIPGLTGIENLEYEMVADERDIRKEKIKQRAAVKAKREREERIKSFSLSIQQSIKKREVEIGMTKEQVILSWGKPEQVNRSVGKWGVHEQWVYGRTYLYFENDVLTSFQDSRN